MRPLFPALLFLALLFAALPALAQETEPETESEAVESPAEAESSGEANLSAELHVTTLQRDIATSGFYELIAWLETLNLSTTGDKQALAARLYDYYGLVPPADDSDSDTPLVVDSAARTRYFTMDDIEERYVRLSGGVTLTLRDSERDVVHRIVADEVTFNQDLNVISATGDVVYTLEREGTVEQFNGAALTVQLDDWDGAFVEGVTERPRTIDGQTVDFSFEGSYMTRSSDDVVVLEDGRVTSSQADPPNYEIRAEKIWILSPGEWGLRNAYLFVGRVPVFYFPFFFRPGDELFFNPAVGVRGREGRFIQTTTYLLGEPAEPESAFSFLQIAEEENSAAATKIDGLYLVPDENGSSDEPSGAELRILADIYTKLGFYAAVDGTFPEAGAFRNIETYAGIGVTRNIYAHAYTGQATTYSPYYLTGGEAVTSWNGTQIGSVRIPFRFGLGFAAATSSSDRSLSTDIELFSDSRFRADFYERSEQIDWLGLVGQGTPTSGGSTITGYNWTVRGSVTPTMQSARPWLQRVQLQDVAFTLRWRAKEAANQTELVSEASSSPEASFFYPDVLQSPSISGLISGQILQLSSSTSQDEEETETVETPLRSPWDELVFTALPEEQVLRLPAMRSSTPAARIPELWNLSLRYTLTPTGLIENTFESSNWDDPADVDFGIGYSAASGRLVGNLPLSANFFSSALSISGSLAMSGQYRALFNRSDTLADATWDSLESQANSYTSANASSNLSLRVSPFTGSRLWAGSTVSYSLNVLLYQLAYSTGTETFDPEWLEWDRDYIRMHQAQLTGNLDIFGGQQLRMTVDLPPRNTRFVGQLDTRYDPVSFSVASGVLQADDDSWTPQPLTSSLGVSLGDLGSIRNQFSYDLDQSELAYNSTSASIGPVNASLDVRTSEGYTFGGPSVGWLTDGVSKVRFGNASLSGSLQRDLEPLWGNRLLLSGNVQSSWSMNLLKYTDSSFSFSLNGGLEIPGLLTLTISSVSNNTQSYVYIGPLAEGVGRERRSLIADLFKSFNFFSRTDREESAFNLQEIRVNLLHDLEDWELTLDYAGSPEIVDIENPEPDGPQRRYEWQSTLSLELRWKAISELSSTVRADKDWDLTFGGDS